MIKEVKLGNYKIRFEYYIDGREVAYVLIEDSMDVVNIIDVYVLPEYRRKGIANKLIANIFEKYKYSYVRFMLEVRSRNSVAIHLYKKFGFEQIHIRKNYYGDDDAVIMEAYL